MDIGELDTVKKISNYVIDKINAYRLIPETIESKERDLILQDLANVFEPKSKTYSLIVKDGKFLVSFTTAMGKGRMGVLKKVLCELYPQYYKAISF